MKTPEKIIGYPFVDHVDQDARPELDFKVLDEVFSSGTSSQFWNVTRYGSYKLMGYAYDFRPWLRRILVRQYGSWAEYLAPNKTKLRECLTGSIQEMVYLDVRDNGERKHYEVLFDKAFKLKKDVLNAYDYLFDGREEIPLSIQVDQFPFVDAEITLVTPTEIFYEVAESEESISPDELSILDLIWLIENIYDSVR